MTGVRFLAGVVKRLYFHHRISTGLEDHPVSYQKGTRILSLEIRQL